MGAKRSAAPGPHTRYLIEDGEASINKADNNGKPPLKLATNKKHTAVIAYLESKGARLKLQ